MVHRRRDSSSFDGESVTLVPSDSDDAFHPSASESEPEHLQPTRKRQRTKGSGTAPRKTSKKSSLPNIKSSPDAELVDIENCAGNVHRPHGKAYHDIDGIAALQTAVLDWFEDVREKRGMPWRQRYDSTLSLEEKGQRAYEIWVSEVMLQQTQVATVIAYWERWMERWPTIADLARADIEEVNAAWRGLGYYRRARSLLAGAKAVMDNAKYKGRLPDDPDKLEKEIDGIGRYTAGAICSIAYGLRTPIVDGNIHRVLTRALALHAPQTAPATIKFLWSSAEDLVDKLPRGQARGIAGDWNQALMELGSQICKPVAPECQLCPLRAGCKAFAELSFPPADTRNDCILCAPISGNSISNVTLFPMRKEKKASREEDEIVCITEWRGEVERKWLFMKRPEKGLLAGLFQPPTTPMDRTLSPPEQFEVAKSFLMETLGITLKDLSSLISTHKALGTVSHIFSHINMTYHVQHLVVVSDVPPELPTTNHQRPAIWLNETGVESANVGTGVKKVWAQAFGAWGKFDDGRPIPAEGKKDGKRQIPTKNNRKKSTKQQVQPGNDIRKVMMPQMPSRKTGTNG